MSFIGNRRSLVQGFITFALLCGLYAVAEGQSKKTSSAPSRPAPAQHNAPSHSSTSRPSTPSRSTNPGGRPATNTGNRTVNNTGRANTGAMNRNAGTMNRNTGTVNRGGAINRGGAMGGRNTNMSGNRGSMGNMAGHNGTASATHGVNRPLAGRQVSLKGGGSASLRPNGQIRSVTRNGMTINRNLNGSRTIVSHRNGATVVTTGRNSGYVQRAYVTRGGRSYVSRTVVVNHVVYTGVYRSYAWGGHFYYGYHPAYFWGPAYYGWAYNPWPAPVYWGWGWGGAPWYGFYGGYFAPYPVYPSAAFWLTDYLISANLQAAYAARAAAAAAASSDAGGGGGDQQPAPTDNGGDQQSADNSGGAVTLTPEVKEAIAQEVKAQIAAQQTDAQQASSSGDQPQASTDTSAPAQQVPAALDPNIRMFIVASDLTVSSNGQECQLTEGDVIKRTSETPDGDNKVTAAVASAKKGDCAVGQEIAVVVDDLQEMHNHFEEQLDNGLKELSSKQGTGGMPKAPDTSTKPSDVPPPPPDNTAAKTLEDQQQAADQTEAQVVKDAFNQGS